MIKVYYKNKNELSFNIIPETKKGSWINVEDPDEKEAKYLVENLGLDIDLIKDALDPYEVPRIEEEDDNIYIFLRYASHKNQDIVTTPLLIVINDLYTISLSRDKISNLEYMLKNVKNVSTTQQTKLLIHIFTAISNYYQATINEINRQIRNKTSNIEKIDNKDITDLVKLERNLNELLSALVPNNITIEKILSGKFFRLFEEDKDLIEDLLLSINQLIDICKSNLKYIVNIREAYTTIMSNNLNKTMKLLTAFTVILTIPTIVSSFWGMNVRLPFADNPLAYLWVLLLIILSSIVIMYIFLRKNIF